MTIFFANNINHYKMTKITAVKKFLVVASSHIVTKMGYSSYKSKQI